MKSALTLLMIVSVLSAFSPKPVQATPKESLSLPQQTMPKEEEGSFYTPSSGVLTCFLGD